MPQVSKQNPNTLSTVSRSGVLGRIAPVHEQSAGIKLLVYGRGKTGKTTLACDFPKPLLLIGTEDGTKSVSNIKGVDFVQLQDSSEIEQLVGLLRKGKYKSSSLDQGGGFQDMILKGILGLDELPVDRSWGMAKRDQWQACGTQFKERLRPYIDLAKLGLNIVIIAHERNFTEEGDSDVIVPTIGAALTPSATGWLNGACDYICQTFLREGTTIVTTKIGDKKVPVSKKTGKIEYCLRIGPHPVFMTGFRVNRRSVPLPEAIVDPTYTKIKGLIDQGG